MRLHPWNLYEESAHGRVQPVDARWRPRDERGGRYAGIGEVLGASAVIGDGGQQRIGCEDAAVDLLIRQSAHGLGDLFAGEPLDLLDRPTDYHLAGDRTGGDRRRAAACLPSYFGDALIRDADHDTHAVAANGVRLRGLTVR